MAKRTNTKHGKHEKYFKNIKSGKSKSSEKSRKLTHKKESKQKKSEKQERSSGYKTTLLLVGSIIGVIVLLLIALKIFSVINEPPLETEEGNLVVSVNGEPVYSDEIDKKKEYYQAQYGPSFTREMVINQTINEMLLLQEADKQGITVSQGEVDNAVDSWLSQLGQQMSDEDLEALLAEENLTMGEYVEDLRENLRKKMIMQKFLNETVLSEFGQSNETNITLEDAQKAYEESPERFDTVRVSHILICYDDSSECQANRTKEEAQELVNDLYERLLEGKSFEELARNYSDCPSANESGELDPFTKEDSVSSAFKEAAFDLKNDGQFTEPVESDFGYHIVKLLEKKDTFDELKRNIMMQLQFEEQAGQQQNQQARQEEAVTEYLAKLRDEAEILYPKDSPQESSSGIKTFKEQEGEVCTEDGKPVVYFFSSTSCPHCSWVGDAYQEVVKEYMQEDKIKAYHWQLDTGNNKLTSTQESDVPQEHVKVFREFSTGGVPTFVFGCKYYRVGNAYEGEDNGIEKEKEEFREVIDKLLS